MKLLSFNILAQAWIDPEVKKHAKSKIHLTKEYRIQRQIHLLKRLTPDIAFLQEITPSVLKRFLKELPMYDTSHCFASIYWQPAHVSNPINGNVIIWKHGLFAKAPNCKVIEIDQSRGIYAAVVEGLLSQSNKTVTLVNVHFDYSLDTHLQTRQFRNLFRKKHIRNQKRVIIAGDFNMGGNDITKFPILPDITKRGFVDLSHNMKTHPFPPPDAENVTHILVRGFKKIAKTNVIQFPTIGSTLQNVGSDHFPVQAHVTVL